MAIKVPFRQIHLDYHTSPVISRIAQDFDADDFAERFVEARVQSVTVFAKCHHGRLYYDTNHPARHPGLRRGLNLLGEQIEALHRRSIRAPIYMSVQFDEYAATTHPEWQLVGPSGAPSRGILDAGWHNLDLSTPYQDYLADQIADVLREFKPVDGMFLDICGNPNSCSKWAIDGMLREGLDPTSDADRRTFGYSIATRYMARFQKMIRDAHRGRDIAIAFNSRPLGYLPQEKRFLRHVEIEALPRGGGYTYFPLNVRFVRKFGLPYMGMTARFHKGWADFGGYKPAAALRYECCQMLAHGGL